MKTLFFLGQAPARPSSKHDIPGTYLHAWLHSIDFSDDMITESCSFYALTSEFPGVSKSGHLPPTKEQILAHRPILQKVLTVEQPNIIVPVGKMAIAEVLEQKNVSLETTIGQKFFINPFQALKNPIVCIPLSHPSGRSAWNHTHKAQVQAALALIKEELS